MPMVGSEKFRYSRKGFPPPYDFCMDSGVPGRNPDVIQAWCAQAATENGDGPGSNWRGEGQTAA